MTHGARSRESAFGESMWERDVWGGGLCGCCSLEESCGRIFELYAYGLYPLQSAESQTLFPLEHF